MDNASWRVCGEGLAFFGRTNRLVSHELRNILAIISETLSLIEEMKQMEKKGGKIPPGRIQALTESVLEEVVRGNRLIRDMNKFAHSVDHFITEVNVRENVALTIEICKLHAPFKKTGLKLDGPKDCTLTTSPLYLHYLVFSALMAFLECDLPGNEIQIAIEAGGDGASLKFTGMKGCESSFPTDREMPVVEALAASFSTDSATGEVKLVLPGDIGATPLRDLRGNA